MGSPAVSRLLFLSFTSYNPDISSDYRQRSFHFWGNASLLGYNQIILYSSILSVSYYPAPGPSFFITDIQNSNKPANKTFIPGIVAKPQRLRFISMDLTSIHFLLSPFSVFHISITPLLCEKPNQITNPLRMTQHATIRESRRDNISALYKPAKYKSHKNKFTKLTDTCRTLAGHRTKNTIIGNYNTPDRRARKSESRPFMPSLEATKASGAELKINATTKNSNTTMALITVIMVISTCDESTVKSRSSQQNNYAGIGRNSWQSKPFEKSGEARPTNKDAKTHVVTEIKDESWTIARHSLGSLITAIMVISTRAAFAVKIRPNFKRRISILKRNSHKARPHKPRNATSNDPNEAGCRKRSNGSRHNEPQTYRGIVLIRVIMVISTRAVSDVKLHSSSKLILRNPKRNPHKSSLPRAITKTPTHLLEPRRKCQLKNKRHNELQTECRHALIRVIMENSMRDGLINNDIILTEIKNCCASCSSYDLDSSQKERSSRKGKSRPVRADARNIDNRLAIGLNRLVPCTNGTYLRGRKNRYLADFEPTVEKTSGLTEMRIEPGKLVTYLRQAKNRYLTGNRKNGRANTENITRSSNCCLRVNDKGKVVYDDNDQQHESINKHSTLAIDRFERKLTSKMKRQKNMSDTTTVNDITRISDLSKSPELLSPISSPEASKAVYKIPKKAVPTELRIVPLPKLPKKQKILTYANSSKAKTKTANSRLVRSRDPRVTKRRLKLYNIPLSARNEITSNDEQINWLEKEALPKCRELVFNCEGYVAQLEGEKQKFDTQLEAVQALQGEDRYKEACYKVCGERMRIDHNIETGKQSLSKQLLSLTTLTRTLQNLIGRNEKLYKTAAKAFSKPIPLLPADGRLRLRGRPSTLDSPISETDAGNMKPKASSSSDSSMDAESGQGRSKMAGPKFSSKIIMYYFLLYITANASDPFYDADATVLGGELSDSSSPDSNNNSTPNPSDAPSDAAAADASENMKQGEEISTMLSLLGAPKPIPEDVKRDLDGVSAAVIKAGGLISNKPQENRERRGQVLELENMDLDLGKPHIRMQLNTAKMADQYLQYFPHTPFSGELDPLIERPDEGSLQRIDYKDLLPPPSSASVPIDFEFDASLPEYVREQKIEFLLVQKPTGSELAWAFPSEENLHKIWTFVRNKLDSDYILDVCLWCRLDKMTGIASIMLSTINLQVMTQVRHEIRIYEEIEGLKFETYCKTLFIKRYGISMYIPKEHAGLSPQRILRALFYKQRDLYTRNVRLLSKHRFKSNAPGYQLGQRSRIGDAILLFDSPELAAKLKPYDEEHRFSVSKGFSVTLKGGMRGEGHQNFSSEMTSTVITNAAEQAMKSALDAHGQE